jgi:coenzyme F420-0:L-glutamate ligase/coenzyme F420-1:gamma-L-glutamate ligase
MHKHPTLQLIGLNDFPLVNPGDDIGELIISTCKNQDIELFNNDVFVITQKIVSKAENQIYNLNQIKPGIKAKAVSWVTKKDPRFIQLVLNESSRILRMRTNTLIVEHKNGFICANAGIDHSNVDSDSDGLSDKYLLLPKNPDMSASKIRETLEKFTKSRLGVLIIDSHGRAWRNGTIGMTIGLSGLPGLVDLRGKEDLFGFKLKITMVGAADELAAGASLLMGQAKEGVPVVIARGFPYDLRESKMQELIRNKKDDLFR